MSRQQFKGKLEAIGPGGAWTYMKVPFSVQKVFGSRAAVGAGARSDDTVQVVMEIDTAPRTVALPRKRKKALSRNKAAKSVFGKLAYSHRKRYAHWVAEAKQAETCERRAAKAAERLAAGETMD
jgi:hypothetical protein